jgi:uncharacterized protein YbjT (DUF2867 family)
METILVTGASGNVGGPLVHLLAGGPRRVRAAVRDTRERRAVLEGVEYAPLDLMQPATYAPALEGVSRLFLMRPPAISDTKRYLNPLIDAARAAGVGQIVFLSLLGADRNPVIPHHAVELHLEQAGVPYTLLRAGFFMQNLSTTHRADIAERGELLVPAGDGRTAFIDTRDIAAVAARVLSEPGHAGQAYPLTGAESLSYHDVATIMSAELGRPIAYRQPSMLRFARAMRARGIAASYIAVMLGIYLTTRLDMAAAVDATAERLLGRPPIAMRQFVRDYRQLWAAARSNAA